MATYSLKSSSLEGASGELAALTNSLGATLQELDAAVNSYKAANEGQTPEAYNVAQVRWNQGFEKMKVALGGGSTALDDIAVNYKRGDMQGAGLF